MIGDWDHLHPKRWGWSKTRKLKSGDDLVEASIWKAGLITESFLIPARCMEEVAQYCEALISEHLGSEVAVIDDKLMRKTGRKFVGKYERVLHGAWQEGDKIVVGKRGTRYGMRGTVVKVLPASDYRVNKPRVLVALENGEKRDFQYNSLELAEPRAIRIRYTKGYEYDVEKEESNEPAVD